MENIETLQAKLSESESREKQLKAQLEDLEDFIENGSMPLHWVNASGMIVWANQAELDLLGYQKEEYIGAPINNFHVHREVIDDILSRLLGDETLIDHPAELICKDGSIKSVLINSSVRRKDGQFVHTRCFTRDITHFRREEMNREELLKELEIEKNAATESENRFRVFADTAPVLLWMSDIDKAYYFFNKGWLEFTGRTMEEESGYGWTEGVHPNDLDRCLKMYNESFDTRQEFYMEYRLKRHDGHYRWISDKGVPRFTEEGTFLGYVGGCMDIEDQKNAAKSLELQVAERTDELKVVNDLLMSQNNLLERNNEQLGSFSYVASHDLQEPLRKISTFLQLILQKDGDKLSDSSKDFAKRISTATRRMQGLIESLLNYSRVDVAESIFEETDLNAVYAEVRSSLNEMIEEAKATIEIGHLPTLQLVPLQMQQLFVNLISNAVKYCREEVPCHITISAEKATYDEIKALGGNNSKTYWKLSFTDNGIGFDQQHATQIFDLFHRLHGKHEYAGTGIGLGICKKIVSNHHGFINATGKTCEGATFRVYLPA
jgi:PAS domain S-box-containing protein